VDATSAPQFVHYLPIATTVLSAAFLVVLLRRYASRRSGTHLLWWAAGVFCYGLGTLLESAITLTGNSIVLNKAWYIAGALLGAYPLAQGTAYLLLRRRTAHVLAALCCSLIVGLSIAVMLSPVEMEALQPHRPSGAILTWQWIRPATPLINGYAALFLIGGAIYSALQYSRDPAMRNRAVGNAWIAFGAILPGIGGGMAKAGIVEGLYVGELVGLVLIWWGYSVCVRQSRGANTDAHKPVSAPEAQPA
jgi:hypothetical protein